MKLGMKPSSAIYSIRMKSNESEESIDCCCCSQPFIPVNSADNTIRICPTCSKEISDNMSDYANSDGENENNVSNCTLSIYYFNLFAHV